MKLRSYLIALVVVAVVPVMIFAGAMIWRSSREQIAARENELVEIAHAISLNIDREVWASIRALEVLATSPHLKSGDFKRFHEQARRVLELHPGWDTIALTEPSGQQVVNAKVPFGSPLRRTDSPFINEIFETRRPVVSGFFSGSLDQRPLIAVGVPVVLGEKVSYSLAVGASPLFLTKILTQQKLPEGWLATIIDQNKITIARTQNLDKFLGQPAGPRLTAKSREAEGGFFRGVTREGILVATGFRRSEFSGWTVAVGIPVSLLEAAARNSFLYTAGGGLLLLLVGGLLAAGLGRRIARPVAALTDAAEKVGRGETPAIPSLAIAEANQVAREIERAAGKRREAENAVRRERDFSDAALDSLPGVFYLFDENKNFIRWNRNFEQVTGYSGEEIARMHPLDFFTESEKDSVAACAEQVFATGASSVEADFVAKDGTSTPYYFTGVATSIDGKRCLIGVGIDITERRRAEEASTSSEERKAAILEAALDSIITIDREGRVVDFNPAAERTFGYSRGEAIGKQLPDLVIPPNLRERHRQGLAHYLATGNGPVVGKRIEITAMRSDGSEFPVELSISALGVEGRVMFTGHIRDITDRKLAEEQLRASEEKFRELAETIREVFWITETEKNEIIYISPAYETIWGRPVEEFYQSTRSWSESIHPEDRARVMHSAEVKQAGGNYDEVYRIRRPDGSIRWIRDRAFPVEGESGDPHRIVGIAEDITERKEAEERVRSLHEIDRAITSTLDLSAVLNVLLEKLLLFLPYPAVSAVWLRGHESGEMEGIYSRNLVEQQSIARRRIMPRLAAVVLDTKAPLAVVDAQKDPRVADSDFFRRNGLVSYLGMPLIANGESLGVLAVYTKEKHEFGHEEIGFLDTLASRAAIAIYNARLYEKMVKANNVKSEFLSVMSHELRTPLNVMIGYTGMIREKLLGDITVEQESALQKVHGHSEALLQMVNSILHATQIEAGKLRSLNKPFKLNELLTNLQSTYSLPPGKELSLRWDYPDDLPTVTTDYDKLSHILQNLINNAIKFTEQGSVTVSVRVGGKRNAVSSNTPTAHPPTAEQLLPTGDRLQPTGQGRSVEFRVTDTGIGIAPQDLGGIFGIFKQLDSSETRLFGGVGIGLYIVKKFTESLGGTVQVASELGKGSAFTVTIPC